MSQGPDQHDTPPTADAPPPEGARKKATLAELLAELKRRRVFRVMAGYGLFFFAMLQVVEPLMHAFDLPAWLLKASVLALVAGFPVAVVLAWVFDLTADGVVRTPSTSSGPRLSRRRAAMLLVGVALVAALPAIGWYAWKRGREADAATTGNASIAVLPFDDLSPGRDQEYFSDGVAGEILNALSRVEGLKVPGRASSFWFKGKRVEPSEVATKLGVAHLLEGSVRRSGKTLRIDAEVIRAADGLRLWAQTFNREEADIFAIQDEIARAVVEALKVRLLPGRVVAAAPGGSRNPEAYRLYLLGRHLDDRGTPETYAASVKALKEATRLDPGFVAARAWLIAATTDVWDGGPSELVHSADQEFSQSAIEEALRSADALVAEAPGDPDALARRGLVRGVFFTQWAGALDDFQRALASRPNDPDALVGQARALAALGRMDEAKVVLRRVTTIDPLKSEAYQWLGNFETASGELARGIATLRRGLEIDPSQPYLQRELAFATLLQGRPQEALALIERNPIEWMRETGRGLIHHTLGHDDLSRAAIARLQGRDRLGLPIHYQLAQVHAWRGEPDQAFQRLELGYASHDGGLQHVRYDALLQRLRADPRYLALIRKIGLPLLPGEAPAATVPPPSIAVLPFADMSPGHDQEYFADGVAEEILNALAHVEGLRVPGRTSSFWFKGKSARLAEIGRELDVAHVLEGSVRRANKRLRVTAQVVNVADGGHLWSETFDRSEADVFAVQDEVARAVVAALKVKLLPGAPLPAAAARTGNLEAYEQYLIGNQFLLRFTTADVAAAVGALERAVTLDPLLASAWARLSVALWWQGQNRDRSAWTRAAAAAERAVALDPGLAIGHAALARVRDDFLLDFSGADAAIARALALDPASSYVLSSACATERTRGRFVAGVAACQKGIDLDPLTVGTRNQLGWTLLAMNDLKRARAVNGRTLEISPGSRAAHEIRCQLDLLERRWAEAEDHCGGMEGKTEALFYRAALRWGRGTRAEADAALSDLVAGGGAEAPFTMAEIHAWRGENDKTFEWLERAEAARDGISDLKSDVFLRPLRGDPRFRALLKKLKLPLD